MASMMSRTIRTPSILLGASIDELPSLDHEQEDDFASSAKIDEADGQAELAVDSPPIDLEPVSTDTDGIDHEQIEPARQASPVQARQNTRTLGSQGKELASFVAHYQAGLADYEESYRIVDSESGGYLGDCGMGINMKNGVLQNNPDHVIALDVWFYDKKADRGQGNQSRVLLSEYAIDNKLEQAFTRERPNDPNPLVAQPGVSFQLKGPNMILDCQIIEAEYTKNPPSSGIFQNVKVQMTVRAKE